MIVLDTALLMLALAFAASIVLASWVEVAGSRQPDLLTLTVRGAAHGYSIARCKSLIQNTLVLGRLLPVLKGWAGWLDEV